VNDGRWLLGFDASTPRCVIALGRVGPGDRVELVIADEHDDPGGNQASVHLVPRLHAVLERAGLSARQLHAVACGCGPGTFTGTRVAVSTAKGLCFGLGCPLVPVSTLAAVALSIGHSGWILPMLDARRGEVYGGLLRVDRRDDACAPAVVAVGEPRCTAASALVEQAVVDANGGRIVAVGTGIDPHRDAFSDDVRADAVSLPGPSAEGLWLACAHAERTGAAVDPALAMPVYLRKSYAELGVNKPKRPVSHSPFV
jgi:tRNA threonylcarbamoyladenosine biosynthesis protein TsaB